MTDKIKQSEKAPEICGTGVPEVCEPFSDSSEASQTTESLMVTLTEMVSSLKVQIRDFESTLKQLKTQHKQELKSSRKKRKNKTSGDKRGEFKPVLLSDEMCVFFGVPKGSVMPRGEATSRVYKYIQSHDLYHKDQPKTFMKPDSKLKKLLGPLDHLLLSSKPEKGNGLSIYNIQKYLQQHFSSAVSV